MRYVVNNNIDIYEDTLDFANMVFSMEYDKIDFSKYLPKAYSEERGGMVTHHMLLDDDSDHIRAIIDTYPVTLKLNAKSIYDFGIYDFGIYDFGIYDFGIHALYIGTVCVHPRYRGRGYFKTLMDNIEDKALKDGVDCLLLDGERSRYQHFGFEKAGIKYSFDIDYKAAQDIGLDMAAYSFEEVEPDSLLIEKMYELYCKRNVIARSMEDFYVCLLSLKASVYAVIEQGRIIGYVNLSFDEQCIYEFELEDYSKISKLMLNIMDGFDIEKLIVKVGADEIDKIKYLEEVSAYYNVSQSHQIKILNYENVIKFLFDWKMKYLKLDDGEFVFGIRNDEDNIVNYIVNIYNSKVSVSETRETATHIFDEVEFVKVFTTVYYYIANIKAPTGWFPLPFFLPDADSF